MNIQDFKKIHFIGIGGIGMSAAAKYARYHGAVISGSDETETEIIDDLRDNYQATISVGHHFENITNDLDAVVYSPAIPKTNPEFLEAQAQNIPLFSYPEFLGKIAESKYTIAVAGTNGKTTTTAMIIEAMKHLEQDPSAIVGGILQQNNSNFVAGSSDYFIAEACEYKGSFLNIYHDILVITNITEDHLDFFKDLADIQNTFKQLLENKKGTGFLVCNTQQENLKPIIEEAQNLGITLIDYSQYLTDDLELPIAGEHNLENFAAALGVIEALGLSTDAAKNYLSTSFVGSKRRMEHIGMTSSGTFIIDDYAHNPEALDLLISGLRDFYPDKKIIMAFEPHLYSRTEDFFDAFVEELVKVDELYLFPIYRAREIYQPEKDFALAEAIRKKSPHLAFTTVQNYQDFPDIFKSKKYDNNHIFITVGAGPIYHLAEMIKKTQI